MAETGILMLAHSRPKYIRQAKWLARSIRYRTSGVPIAVATDLDAAAFDGLFDVVIPWQFGRWPGVACKLELFDISPFDTTLALDTDCLCVRSMLPVFDYFAGQDFTVYGANLPDYHWADGTDFYRTVVDAESYPSFNGGLYYFRKSPIAREVFERAKGFSENYHTLGLSRPRGKYNDELLISLAMASLGLRATDKTDRVIMVAPEEPAFAIDLDLLRGHCAFVRRGRVVEPEIVHFVGVREWIPAYRRERMVLDLIVGRGWPAAIRPLLAFAAQVETIVDGTIRWARRKFAGLRRRLA